MAIALLNFAEHVTALDLRIRPEAQGVETRWTKQKTCRLKQVRRRAVQRLVDHVAVISLAFSSLCCCVLRARVSAGGPIRLVNELLERVKVEVPPGQKLTSEACKLLTFVFSCFFRV